MSVAASGRDVNSHIPFASVVVDAMMVPVFGLTSVAARASTVAPEMGVPLVALCSQLRRYIAS
jgi:uncharacterized membrane protein